MKKLPEVNVSFEELYRMLLGPIKSKLLLTGIELKIFNHLPESKSAEVVAEAIGTHPENTRLFLDGGPGLVGMTIVASHPSMKGVIFDKPAIVKVANTFIKECEIEDRMGVLAGDYNYDSIGEEYDLIWASNALNFGKDNMDSLVKKIYDALNPGGVFMVLHEGLTHERTKPDTHVLCMLFIALMGQDMCFDQGFIADSMLRVGFKSVRSCTLDTNWGPMDLDIARK